MFKVFLFERERVFKLSEQKSLELSKAEESLLSAKKRRIDYRLSQIANSIIADGKRNN
jgi:hypothetical protein